MSATEQEINLALTRLDKAKQNHPLGKARGFDQSQAVRQGQLKNTLTHGPCRSCIHLIVFNIGTVKCNKQLDPSCVWQAGDLPLISHPTCPGFEE